MGHNPDIEKNFFHIKKEEKGMRKKFVSALLCTTMIASLGTFAFADDASAEKPFEGQKLTVLYMSGVYADAW